MNLAALAIRVHPCSSVSLLNSLKKDVVSLRPSACCGGEGVRRNVSKRDMMKTRKALLAALCLVLTASLPALATELTYGAAIYGKDERRPFNGSAAERDLAKKIGGVVGGHGVDAQSCSAVLVGPDLVAFAAHCIYDDESKKPRVPLDTLRYFPYWPNLKGMVPIRDAKSLWIGEKFLDGVPGHDWAIVRLARPVDPGLGHLAVQPFSGKWSQEPGRKDPAMSGKISLIAFHQDLYAEIGPMISPDCNVYTVYRKSAEPRSDPALFVHDCDAAPGASGGAFVTRDGNGHWALVGIEQGVYGDMGDFRAGDPFDYSKRVSVGVGSIAFHALLQDLLVR